MGFQPLKLEGNLRNSLWPAIACDQGLSQQYSLNRTTEHAQMRMRGLVRDIRDIWICPNAEMLFGNNFWWAFMAAIKCTCRIISTSNTSSLMALTCHESWFAPIHHPLIWEAHLTYLMPFYQLLNGVWRIQSTPHQFDALKSTSQWYPLYPLLVLPSSYHSSDQVVKGSKHTHQFDAHQIQSSKHTLPICWYLDQWYLSDSSDGPVILPFFRIISIHSSSCFWTHQEFNPTQYGTISNVNPILWTGELFVDVVSPSFLYFSLPTH